MTDDQYPALVGGDYGLATIAAQANRTHRWLAALPPKKLKNNKKTIYLMTPLIVYVNKRRIYLI
ncbi:MAG: hypothetical protein MPK62_08950 [Alphaproteobacteria bacterium]|nr:hypothetical protein [Alphaproteobacteria bacterium]